MRNYKRLLKVFNLKSLFLLIVYGEPDVQDYLLLYFCFRATIAGSIKKIRIEVLGFFEGREGRARSSLRFVDRRN